MIGTDFDSIEWTFDKSIFMATFGRTTWFSLRTA